MWKKETRKVGKSGKCQIENKEKIGEGKRWKRGNANVKEV